MKRTTVFLLAIIMILAMTMVSCQTNEPEASSEPSSVSETTTEKTEETATPEEPEEPMDIYYADKARGAAASDEAVLAYINEKFNINFHYTQVPGETLNEKFTTMIAAGENLDFFLGWYADPTNPRSIDIARDQGLIVPLDDLLANYGQNLLKEVKEEYWDLTKVDGKIWFVPNVQFKSKKFMYVRTDWLADMGLEKPATLDEFENMLKEMKSQNPGGQDNFYPLVGENFGYLWTGFLGSFVETAGNFVDTDGQLKPEFFHPNYKLFLQTLQDWYAAGLINPDQATIVREQEREQVETGKAGVWITWFGGTRLAQINETDPEAMVSYLNFPVGPSGTGGAQSVGIFSGGGQVIMSHCSEEKQIKIMQMLDWFQTEEGQLFQYYGIEGQDWVDNGDTVSLPEGVTEKQYNTFYMVSGGNMYAYYKALDSTAADYLESLDAALSGEYASIDPPDYMYPYNWADTESVNYMTDLNTLRDQMMVDIMTGVQSVDYLDEWLEIWLGAGGETYIEELNQQYSAISAQMGK